MSGGVPADRPLTVFLVAGEESGDLLGSNLMRALKVQYGGPVRFLGVGGGRMAAEGLTSLFPLSDIAVMGLTAVLARLPTIVRRVHQTVDAAVAADPDVMVIIDSPDFTHNVAKRVRKRAPHIPIVDYVSPSVWAWRPGRARKMSVYVDRLLALLPFEPEAHRRLGGPPTFYVGHPLIEKAAELRPAPGERRPLSDGAPVLLVLPGSRGSEVSLLLEDFGATVERLAAAFPGLEVLLPAVPHLAERIAERVASWPVKPQVVLGEAAKHAAFRRAHAALAASGTVSLELAASGVPMAICYKLDWFYRRVKQIHSIVPIASVSSMVLPNIILGRNIVPEFLDEEVTPGRLVPVLEGLLSEGPARADQVDAFKELDEIMRLPDGRPQSEAAARLVLDLLAPT
ncbi:lipid-A-disaccharide synthase [Polymorphum gilvum]|uniref:Lipid-A-disaccharide synthase n=1 Tax=Polymorphum gilvum (strain LMG 25793 / CGMCC 1.9160 / SL003B-26A1) TaxID=991905 RepID=F2IY28_POLGS|nr:lipid-A-disaccharide synthase [Polymorphum gilvum]ADZ70531.1 Glycosyl transferase, family 19 [Polymorphum gilvum SL003B-26A1]